MIKSFEQFVNENLTSLVDRYKNQEGVRKEDMLTWDDIDSSIIYAKYKENTYFYLKGYYYLDDESHKYTYIAAYKGSYDEYRFDKYYRGEEFVNDVFERDKIDEIISDEFDTEAEAINDFRKKFPNCTVLNIDDLREMETIPDGYYIDINHKRKGEE